MTVQQAITNIYSYFISNPKITILEIDELLKNTINITELGTQTLKDIYFLAAEEMVKMGYLFNMPKNSNRWVLNKDIASLPQTIEISGQLAEALSKLNNKLASELGLEHKTNSIKINDTDLSFLVIYATELLFKKD